MTSSGIKKQQEITVGDMKGFAPTVLIAGHRTADNRHQKKLMLEIRFQGAEEILTYIIEVGGDTVTEHTGLMDAIGTYNSL